MSAGSALETAAAVRAGERSAREVIDESLAAIDEANACLLYTSDAADERSSVDIGGRRIINKKKKHDRNNSKKV